MNQKKRKEAISDWLTVAMGKLTFALVLIVLLVGLPVYGLWWLTSLVTYTMLRWVAVGLVFGLALSFAVGFYFAKVEVRGFLGGLDTGIDKLSKAVDLRDNSRLKMHEATRKPEKPHPDYGVYLPDPQALQVPVTHRQLAGGEVIDL